MNKKDVNLLIWPFGTSDLYLDGNKIDTKNENFIEKTKEISEKWEEYKNKIDFLIFRAIVEDDDFDKSKYTIIKGIFTNQIETSRGRITDTIYLKDIFEKWLNFHKNEFGLIKFSREHFVLTNPINVEVVYKELSDLIEKQLLSNENFLTRFDLNKTFVNTTGGTKQMIVGLILSVLNKFDISKLNFIYGEEKFGETIPRYQNVYIDWFHSRQLSRLANKGDFEFIKSFIEENNLEDKYNEIYKLSNYGFYRLLCNWEEVYNIYKQLNLSDVLYVSKNAEKVNLLEESINGIIYTWRQNRLAEFMGRTYNFLESILTRESLKHFFGTNDITYRVIYESLDRYKDLKDFLDKCKVKSTDNGVIYIGQVDKGLPLKWNIEEYSHLDKKNSFINSIVALALLDYFSTKGLVDRKIFNCGMLLQDLSQYRNKTVIGHGTEPINKEIVKKRLQTNNVEGFFKDILKVSIGNNILWIDILKDEILKKF